MASGAAKVKSKIPVIAGTKPSVKNAQLLISTGIPSLDHIIGLLTCIIFSPQSNYIFKNSFFGFFPGGGLPIGSIFIIGMYLNKFPYISDIHMHISISM